MTVASRDALLGALADLVARLEAYALTLLPTMDAAEVALGREDDGSLVVDLGAQFPGPRSARAAELDLFERWTPAGRDRWVRGEYRYELRHHGLGYRRALHRHHADRFVRAHDVATHEHCEVAMGLVACAHHAGAPVIDAFDAFERLYGLWLTGDPPDCAALRCLG